MEALRRKIDSVDAKLQSLLKQRFDLVQKIGRKKKKAGQARYQPERERAILASIKGKYSTGKKRIFKVIMRESRRVQGK